MLRVRFVKMRLKQKIWRTFAAGGTIYEIVDLAGQGGPPFAFPPLLPAESSPYEILPSNIEPTVAS